MNHLIWRLHRNQAYFATAAIVALAVILVVTGLVMSDHYHQALVSCRQLHSCGDLSDTLFQGDGFIIDLVNLSIVAPVLLGLFWGVPLVAKELEDGTHIFAWTQDITRRQWMQRNLFWALGAAAIWGALLSLLVTWWRIPENALFGRFAAFDIEGVVPVAYSIFAVSLGIALGTWLRRLLPALAATLALLVAVRVAVGLYLRPHYVAAVRAVEPLLNNRSGAPTSAWILSRSVIGPKGHAVDTNNISFLPAACGNANAHGDAMGCLARLGYHRLVTYQPDDRFWAFQGIEAAIFVALACVLVALAYRTVIRRDA